MLNIGWATRDFTPDRPAMLQGQRERRIASEALDPLTCTALAIEGGEPVDSAIIISCDMVGITEELWADVRKLVKSQLPGFDTAKLIMHATHTHTSLTVHDGHYELPGEDVMTPDECRKLVAESAAEAAVEAWNKKYPQLIERAFGHAVVGHNRMAVYSDNHAQMYGETHREDFSHCGGYEDHSLDMLYTHEPEGTLTGMLLGVPCPSQVTEHLEMFSADYWHEVREELRRRLGKKLFVLPVCSAAGDQSPHFLLYGKQEAEMRERRGVTEREEIARRISNAVLSTPPCPHHLMKHNSTLRHEVINLELPPRKITKKERDQAEQLYKDWIEEHGESESWSPKKRLAVVETFDGKREPQPFSTEIHVLRINDVAFATNPFELFIDYGLRIKARSPAAQTVLCQLAGNGWYLPTERAVGGGGYGAWPEVCRVGPEGGQMLVEETLKVIEELWKSDS